MARPGLIRRLRRAFRGADRREPGRVNHVALGNHCHMAQILKETGLRGWSGPYDWIFSAPGMVRDGLADDFAALLDRSQYRSTPLSERPAPKVSSCRHDLYAERYGIPYVFNHHDPATSEADYRFLADGVRRLRAALAMRDADNRFYVLATRPTPDDDILGLVEALAAYGPNNRLAVIQTPHGVPRFPSPLRGGVRGGGGAEGTIEPDPAPPPPPAPSPQGGGETRRAGGLIGADIVAVSSPHASLTWLRVPTASDSLGLRFADPADEERVRALVRDLAASP